MEIFFDLVEQIFFTELIGDITLYTILATILKFIFVIIVLRFIASIVRMITLDIRSTWGKRTVESAMLRLLTHPDNIDFPVRNEYYLSDNTTIGRADENNIVIKDRRLSKYQAKIVESGSHFYIDDLGSTNPTLVNEIPVTQPQELYSRDIIQLGSLEFVFIDGNDDEA